MFPISVVLMGQTPIATTTSNIIPEIALTVPLADFDFPYQNVTPVPALLTDLLDNAIYLDFKVFENSSSSWSELRTWLEAINGTELEYSVTLVADREVLADESPASLATSELIEEVYQSHGAALDMLVNHSLVNITKTPEIVLFDMTLSRQEWQALMIQTRSLNLVGFGGLLRTSLYSTRLDRIKLAETGLHEKIETSGLSAGLVVESFVIDDIQDRDTGAMRLCGVTMDSFSLWDRFIVSCERSRFSFEMGGDVGEYLTHSFSSSVAGMGNRWGLRLGEIGNSTDIIGRQDNVYEDFDTISNDIALATGNGVSRLIIGSLPSLLSTFGTDAVNQLRITIDAKLTGVATYTFRIYAFRAVFMAIDAFDFIML
jgi:hypothetical protein